MTFLTKGMKKPETGPPEAALISGETGASTPKPPPIEGAQSPFPHSVPKRRSLPVVSTLLATASNKSGSSRHLAQTNNLKPPKPIARDLPVPDAVADLQYFRETAQRLQIPFLIQVNPDNLHPYLSKVPLENVQDLNWVMMRPFAEQTGLTVSDRSRLLCAPTGEALDRLEQLLNEDPGLRERVCMTAPSILHAAQRTAARNRALDTEVYQLKHHRPHMSAHTRLNTQGVFTVHAVMITVIALALFLPSMAIAFNILSIFVFLAIAGLRIAAYFASKRLEVMHTKWFKQLFKQPMQEEDWPTYTVLLPLYREAAVIKDLVLSLSRLEYPRDKLSIQLLVEADDHETWQALTKLTLPRSFTVVSIPVHGPRTKPKALNYALSFVKSELVVIYDAEDRPNPLQLKEAALRMLEGGLELACLQGRLCIDNGASSFLSRQFAVEYAALFDGFLPYLASNRFPVPLGGTSNHFRTKVLKEAGGWDPFNVTEDADLGLRLTRLGYRIEMLQTETWEEAPESYNAWIKQRTRWFKGWMQTWLVHMRNPIGLWRGLGLLSFCVFQAIIAGMLISALIHPIYIVTFAATFATILLSAGDISALFWMLMAANSLNLLLGYGGTMALGYRKAKRRYGYGLRTVFGMPLYWLMMTPAAWRALVQLLDDPHHWEKTQHGVSSHRPCLNADQQTMKKGSELISDPL